MTMYENEEEVYKFLGRIFQAAFEDPELKERFAQVGGVLRINYRNPDAVVNVDFSSGIVELGSDTTLVPEAELFMDTDVGHRFWLGKVNVPVAMAKGQIKSKGPVTKVMKIAPLTKPLYETYRTLLAEGGKADLIDA